MEPVAILVRVDTGTMWQLPQIENQTYGIGRSTDNWVALPEEQFISRRHAVLQWQPGGHQLKVGRYANNGISVNGRDTSQAIVQLTDFDTVQCANVRFRYLLGADAALRAAQVAQAATVATKP